MYQFQESIYEPQIDGARGREALFSTAPSKRDFWK